jgi:uncharacterized protein YecE (DUF72 family)
MRPPPVDELERGGARPFIGTAGWSIPRADLAAFPESGSHLARYARVLNAVEINSSFHRPHRRSTYERWAQSVPPAFRFSVKLPKEISHTRRLVDVTRTLAEFVDQSSALGEKLGAVLLQLPPSMAFDAGVVAPFLAALQHAFAAAGLPQVPVVCEPRHVSWFAPPAEACLADNRVARVAADPAIVPAAALPGGWPGLAYWRWHGSPRIYRSRYDDEKLAELRDRSGSADAQAPFWCIFDNTASGAATGDALRLKSLFQGPDLGSVGASRRR